MRRDPIAQTYQPEGLRPEVVLEGRVGTLRAIFAGVLLLCSWPATPLAAAGGFPPITDAQRDLVALSWEPGARAVVLEKSGEFWMLDESRNRFSSRLVVRSRIKILGAGLEGELGEVELLHGADHRLHQLAGRTVRPDGTVVPLGEGAIFERTVSEKEGLQATILVFPAVEVGAILDYSYEIRFDSIWFLEPWYFQDRYPVELSRIVYHLPADIATVSWGQATFDRVMEHESVKEPGGSAVKVWMRQLPAIPREQLAQPFEDMSSRFMVLPTYLVESGRRVNLLESWTTTCALVDDYIYSPYWARARKAKAKTKELISGVSGVTAKIDALFVFVRDEIDSLGWSGVTPYRDTVDALLAEGSGSSADKTLMLHKMFEIAGVESEIVWIADRSSGRIDPQVANPGWFDRPILRVAVGGESIFLDPASPAGPGYLPPGAEGMPALLFHQRNPTIITMPPGAAEDSRRRVVFNLAVTDDGGVGGTATVELTGHHAAATIDLLDSAEAANERWRDWLESELATFDVSDVEASEEADGPRVTVRFSLTLADDEILGDEIALTPSRPWGPVHQPFVVEQNRRAPVLLDFAHLAEVTLHLVAPEPWTVDAMPAPVNFENAAGSLTSSTTVGAGGALTYQRRLLIADREFSGRLQYQAIRQLYSRAARHDVQELVLVRP